MPRSYSKAVQQAFVAAPQISIVSFLPKQPERKFFSRDLSFQT